MLKLLPLKPFKHQAQPHKTQISISTFWDLQLQRHPQCAQENVCTRAAVVAVGWCTACSRPLAEPLWPQGPSLDSLAAAAEHTLPDLLVSDTCSVTKHCVSPQVTRDPTTAMQSLIGGNTDGRECPANQAEGATRLTRHQAVNVTPARGAVSRQHQG